MNSIKNYILQQVATKAITQEQAKQFLLELSQAQAASSEAASSDDDNAVAIIGMSGRFPKAENVDEFWQLLRDGVNCVDDFPEERQKDFEHILRNPYYTEFLIGDAIAEKDIHRAHAKAGYMKQIDKFDANFFGIPPSEATHMDPNQRQALECAWEAMEDAGYGGETLYGKDVGVYIGKENTNYSLYRYCAEKDPMQLTGTWESIMASRISYLFNFRGPCMVVDTACSAGLVSVHMGAAAVLNGDCDLAIAGGINLSIVGELNTEFQGGMTMDSVESSDGKIRTFDAKANGTVWGEGVALVLLKPLKKALQDGDHIHAIIKGSAINNDGASNGLTAPNADAQEDVIVKAWENAGINPETLSYIEAHGTGTVLGDPIEFKGLTGAFRRYTQKKQFCAIGSLKTNMGHLVAASGCASLFKVVKQMQHKQLAPTINFSEPNPYISFQTSPLYVNDQLNDWKPNGPKRAAISSFGFSHTNCHMVIEEAPAYTPAEATRPAYVLSISAKKPALLLDYIERYQDRINHSDEWNLADLCYTANIGRGHYASRIAIVANSEQSLSAQLEAAKALVENSEAANADSTVFYNTHGIVSEKKTQREAGEITDKEKKQITQNAAAALSHWLESGNASDITEVAQQYVAGADVNWSEVYKGEKRHRLAIPTYPFERVRLWAEPKITKIADFTSRLHPLVDRQSAQSDNAWTYESVFTPENHWVLSDHKIKNTCVVPGTTYLEMARFAVSHALGLGAIDMQNIFFLQPMVVEENEQRLVRITVTKENDTANFSIESRDSDSSDDNDWQQHVEGKAVALTDAPSAAPDIPTLQKQLPDFEEHYSPEMDTGVFQFGPHWNSVRSSWTHNERFDMDALAKLSLPQELQGELDSFLIHPSVLDNAMNLTSQTSGHTFLPFMYKSFRFYRPFSTVMYSYIKPGDISDETHNYDVVLVDEEGQVLAEINGYVTKKVHSFNFSGDAQNEYLALRWVPAGELSEKPVIPSTVSVFAQEVNSDLSDAFADAGIKAQIHSLDSLTPERAAELAQGELQSTDAIAIVMNQPVDFAKLTNDQSAALQKHSNDALFSLIKANAEHKVKLNAGLLVLTQNSVAAGHDDKVNNPWGASVTYLALTAAQEDADLSARVLDADSIDKQSIAQLIALPVGKRFALRNSQLTQAELYPTELAAVDSSRIDSGVYVITGGLGGLGLATADYLAQQAQQRKLDIHIVLTGRSTLADAAQWGELATQANDEKQASRYSKLVDLQKRVKSVRYLATDIANPESVHQLISDANSIGNGIRGIFHTAGIAGDGFILRKTAETFESVLSAKVNGTVFMLNALRELKISPDFVLLFSSTTALTAGEGQSDYAAANAFMDAIASNNNGVYAINWPSWAEVGMAADYGIGDENSPFALIAPAQAFAKMEAIFAASNEQAVNNIIPSDVNPAVLADELGHLPIALVPELETRLKRAASSNADAGVDDVDVDIRGKSEDDLTETEITLAKVYAAVLGLTEIDIFTNFQDMGGNSIIATHLLKVIDEYFPSVVDISDVFSYPAIDVMAEYIDEKRGVESKPAAGASEEKAEDKDWDNMLDSVVDGEGSIDDLLDSF
ncbi:type I polyketide synthase [Alteromonas sp. a30]|uniref:type I polyketide synthase n=1 Tax=Alteromonas sp. a30 TaxID=2730917 RepID=UPI00227DD240|nr:SDR family oxidoreductase [Alteromonas sp. a30]MCY7295211.1 SDR family oxidoreductase [Alteromonas sp. a30]